METDAEGECRFMRGAFYKPCDGHLASSPWVGYQKSCMRPKKEISYRFWQSFEQYRTSPQPVHANND